MQLIKIYRIIYGGEERLSFFKTEYRVQSEPAVVWQMVALAAKSEPSTNVGLALGQRRRRWANVKSTMVDSVFVSVSFTHAPRGCIILDNRRRY